MSLFLPLRLATGLCALGRDAALAFLCGSPKLGHDVDVPLPAGAADAAEWLADKEAEEEVAEPLLSWPEASETLVDCGIPDCVCSRPSPVVPASSGMAGSSPSEVSVAIPPCPPSEGRPTSELLRDAAELLEEVGSSILPGIHWKPQPLMRELFDRAALCASIEAEK